MALAKRLYLTFKDLEDQSWTVNIYHEGFAGTASEMDMSGDPVLIRWGGDKWKNIIGSECQIQILSSDSLTWLNTTNGRGVKVEIVKGATVWWEGFALPNQYYDALNAPRYFTLSASDGIGTLRDSLFTDNSGNPFEGYDSAIDCLAQALNKTGLELKLRSTVDLFEVNMNYADTDDPLKQADIWRDFVQSVDLYPGNAYDMVDIILKTFHSRIYQSSGFWHVNRIPSYSGTVDYRDFTFDNINLEYDYNSNGSFDPKKATGSSFKLLRGGAIETNEPFKQLQINLDYGLKPTIIKGSTFPQYEFDGSSLRHWTNTGSDWEKYNSSSDYGIIMESIDGSSFDETKYLVSDSVETEYTTSKYKFSLDCGSLIVPANNNWRPYLYIRLVVDDGAGTYYWLDDLNNGWQSESSLADCKYVNYTSGTLGFKPPGVESFKDTEDITFYLNGFPAGSLSVYIHNVQNNPFINNETVLIKGFTLSIADTNTATFPLSSEEITVIDDDNKILAEYEINLTDIPTSSKLNKNLLYGGVIRENVTNTPTYEWFEKDTPGTTLSLSEWLATFTDADTPYYTFRGQIYGSADYFNTIQLTEYDDELFFWTDVEFNIKKVLWNGEAVQMKGVMLNPTGTSTSEGVSVVNNKISSGGNITINNLSKDSYSDNEFEIYNIDDQSKIAKFDASGITADNTRTYILPDSDGTIALLSDITGGIGGTVAAGYVPYGASADTLANSVIRANTSLVGIGTSPTTGRKVYISQLDNTGDPSDNAYGLYIAVGGVPDNNNYGIYIACADGGNDGYAIYTASGDVYFDDLTTLNGAVTLNTVADYGAPSAGSRILTLNEATDVIEYIDYSDFGGGAGTVTSVAAGNGMDFSTITGSGSVTLGTPSTLTSATSNALTSTSHTHAITCGISATNIVKIAVSAVDNDYAKFTSTGLEGRSYAEVASDIGAMTNPMTAQGDIIKGGSSGTPERLAKGTVGQMLYHDGTDPYWDDAPSGSGDISGSGTAGYIPYFSATQTIANSNIRFSSDNVGINQAASSDSALAITTSDTYALFVNSGNVRLKDDLELQFGDAGDVRIDWNGSLLQWSDSSANQIMTLTPSGGVGSLGVTGAVTVNGNIKTDGTVKIAEQSSPGQAASGYGYLFFNTSGALCYTNDGSSDVYIVQVSIPV